MKPTPKEQAERERNWCIVCRMMRVRKIDLETAMTHTVYRCHKSDRLCRGLDLYSWEVTFPKVFPK
jgi:hypothetical protein